jgi:hypothetical protein
VVERERNLERAILPSSLLFLVSHARQPAPPLAWSTADITDLGQSPSTSLATSQALTSHLSVPTVLILLPRGRQYAPAQTEQLARRPTHLSTPRQPVLSFKASHPYHPCLGRSLSRSPRNTRPSTQSQRALYPCQVLSEEPTTWSAASILIYHQCQVSSTTSV